VSILSILLLLSTARVGNFLASASGKTTVYVDPQACYRALGSTFEVNVSVADVSDLYGYQFKLYYDTSILDGIEVRLPKDHFLDADLSKLWIAELDIEDEFNATSGRVGVGVCFFGQHPGISGSGVLVTITFRVTKMGNCTLDLDEASTLLVNTSSEAMPRDVQDGFFQCKTAENEIAVFLEVPSHLVPGEVVCVNATVKNGGQKDETDVELLLLINGTTVSSEEILLPAGLQHTLSYQWTPLDEAKYNVTACAPSLSGEEDTLNNADSKIAVVSAVIRVPFDFPTIQEAIQVASPGDTIRVASGTYRENLVIDRSVNLIGENKTDTIIDGNGAMKTVQVGKQWSYGWVGGACVIRGFTIRNGEVGVHLLTSDDNLIEENIIQDNTQFGVFLSNGARDNVIRRNTIMNNKRGVVCDVDTYNNTIYHNNFINNTEQAVDNHGQNTWSNDEGNYWSDYNGTDTDEDSIGDTSYQVNATLGTSDVAPLVREYVCLPCDLNDDGTVNQSELEIVAASFGSRPRNPRWNSAADLNIDGIINIVDVAIVAKDCGKTAVVV
jgi:parallel beta-helix repeat protein